MNFKTVARELSFSGPTLNMEQIEGRILAFMHGDYNLAVQMIVEVQHPETIRIEFQEKRDVSLLHFAAMHGWLDIVMRLHIKADARDSLGRTPLHYAAQGGHLNVVTYLYIKLQEVATGRHNWSDCYGSLPLHVACLCGHLNVADYLITKQKCDPSSRDKEGYTPLHFASANGHVNIVRYLTKLGCDPNACDIHHALPLHLACAHGHIDVAKLLIEQNCDPNCQTNQGYTPLHCASQYGHMNIVQYLTKELGCDPVGKKCISMGGMIFFFQTYRTTNLSSEKQCLPLHLACKHGHLCVVKYFIDELKCEPTIPGEFGATPLHYACDGGQLSIIQYLVTEKGCDLKKKYSCLQTPIAFACHFGHLNIVKYFTTLQNVNPNKLLDDGGTLLHFAATSDNVDVIKYLINECGCRESLDDFGVLPVHHACIYGCLNAIKCLINEQNCNDPSCRDLRGRTPLHHACAGGHMNIIDYLVTELGCDSRIADKTGTGTLPIHVACKTGHLDVLKYFIAKQNSDRTIRERKGWTPLHYATEGGHVHIIEYLITELQCDPSCRDSRGRTPLHLACAGGHMNIIHCLVTKLGCDPKIADKTGTLPIHVICQAGHLDVLKYFIAKQNSDRTIRGRNGWTPLHYATAGGHVHIIEYLIKELQCDPLIADDNSTTILQLATNNGHIHIVQWLLHNGWFGTQDIDKAGETCIDVTRHTRNRYKLLRLFRPLTKIAKTFDIHTFSKVILIGNSSAGKSTLAKVISERATTYFNFFRFGNVLQVQTNTAGIIQTCIKSWEIGKIVLYDLAGQTEYHSSHSALMEIAMQQFPATFIIVLDLNDKDGIQKLHYWLNFADNATNRTNDKSCLIVIGSHADLLSDRDIVDKVGIVRGILKEISFLNSFGIIPMDCRKINSSGTREFVQLLCKSHETLLSRAPKMSYYCHLLYAFLQYKQIVVCTLKNLVRLLAKDDDCPIPLEYSFLTELLVTLSNKGIVVFLKNMDIVEKSWVVADTDVLLKDINGILFAPKEFKEHHEVSSSTGIVRSSSLQQFLSQYNLQMLVSFLELLQICHRVNLSGITTNLQQIGVSSPDDDHHETLLFFPCLLEVQRVLLPDEEGLFSNWFGWCLSCKHQKYCFFTSRFLHVLLLRLIGTFPLADSDATTSAHRQQKRCTVWTNGISWDNEKGIRTVVELIDQNQHVVVVMSHIAKSRPLKCSKHRSAVIRLIRDLKEDLFPQLDVSEYLISPNLLKNWPSEDVCLPDKVLCPMKNVANSMLLHDPSILSLEGRLELAIDTEDTLLNEPYYQLSPFSVCELLDENKANVQVPQNLLNEINIKFSLNLSQTEEHTHSSLQKVIEKFSIFSGLNPIVSALLIHFKVIMYLFWNLYRKLQAKLPKKNSFRKLQKVLINVSC